MGAFAAAILLTPPGGGSALPDNVGSAERWGQEGPFSKWGAHSGGLTGERETCPLSHTVRKTDFGWKVRKDVKDKKRETYLEDIIEYLHDLQFR